jgi:hypothetical protein
MSRDRDARSRFIVKGGSWGPQRPRRLLRRRAPLAGPTELKHMPIGFRLVHEAE